MTNTNLRQILCSQVRYDILFALLYLCYRKKIQTGPSFLDHTMLNEQSVFEFLAHLSLRLIGELIVYPWSVFRRRHRRRPQCSNIFFSETAWPIEAKFYVEPPCVGGTIFCSRQLGHMTKMAATPIYGKNPSKSSTSEPAGRFSRNLVCSIGDSSPSKFVQMMTLE